MLSFVREEDELWDVAVVVYCVWTVVLLISSLIVLSCLKRETKKFYKRLARAENKLDNVQDMPQLEPLLARYVKSKLGLGVLATMANSFDDKRSEGETEELRSKIEDWFRLRRSELKSMNYSDKLINRTILAALRARLTKHPLDIRGSRRSLEAAKIFLAMESKKEKKISFLQTSISVAKVPEAPESVVCPTIACDWVTVNTLKCLSMIVSMPNATPLFFAFMSFCVWLFDTVTDMAIIDKFWNFRLPILYPTKDSNLEDVTYLSYQTLTIDLYAPLLLLTLLFSLVFTLLSCSCSRLSDKYRLAAEFSKPECELPNFEQDPTTVLARYDFNISSAITSSLPQFSLQFAAYVIVIYLLETLKGLSVDQATKDQIEAKVEEFSFASIWFSGVGSGVALIVAQYTAFKIQHEHGLTLAQRVLYFTSCMFNTVAMMCSALIMVVVIFLPASTYIGRYHIMAIVILGAAILGIGFLICAALAGFGLDSTKIQTDRINTVLNTDGLLTSYLRFTQTGEGKWRTVLGATTLIGRIFSLLTVNLFLPPSQLLVHPFLKFYSTSPRSPALHYAIAKQIIYYNILTVLSSILLCVDIGHYGFNYNITPTTKNLLIYANICGVPCLFIALLILFKFYSTYDIWTSNGVHLVFQGDCANESLDEVEGEETTYTILNQTDKQVDLEDGLPKPGEESELEAPEAESTQINVEDVEDATTEADRMSGVRKQSKILLKRGKDRINRRLKRSCFGDCVLDTSVVDPRGKWIDVSDLPVN